MSSRDIQKARRGVGSGIAFVVTGPSGAGKTSVIVGGRAELPGLGFSVSHTTRSIRDCETDGVDYVFVDDEEFDRLVHEGAFVEHAVYSSARYGTSLGQLEKTFAKGLDIILNVEVQGAENLRKTGLGENPIVLIFLATSTFERLAERLRERGTDSEAKIAERIGVATQELECLEDFDYLVINDDLDEAVAELRAIIVAERLRLRSC